MSISGITTTADNGVNRVTNQQLPDGAVVDGETIILDRLASQIRANGASGIIFRRTQIKMDSDVRGYDPGSQTNTQDAPITYGPQENQTNTVAITEGSSVISGPNTERKNLLFSELSDSVIAETDEGRFLYIFPQDNAVMVNSTITGIDVMEIGAGFSKFFNVRFVRPKYGFFNWEQGRVDLIGLDVESPQIASGRLGSAGAGDNNVYLWNRGPSMDMANIEHMVAANFAVGGYLASWRVYDIFESVPVQDATLIYRESRNGGAQTEVARYTTDANGTLAGTFDSQFRVTGADTSRPTLYIETSYTDTTGSDHQGGGAGVTYSIRDVVPAIEIRSYYHKRFSGFTNTDTLTLTGQIGAIDADRNVVEYVDVQARPETALTATPAQARAYTEINDGNEFVNRAQVEWFDNDNTPYLEPVGNSIDLGGYAVELDSQATPVFEVL